MNGIAEKAIPYCHTRTKVASCRKIFCDNDKCSLKNNCGFYGEDNELIVNGGM